MIMKKFICSVCGYVHEGDAAPEKCPQCRVPANKFNELVEGIRTKLFVLPEETRVYPGHGYDTSIGYEKKNNP